MEFSLLTQINKVLREICMFSLNNEGLILPRVTFSFVSNSQWDFSFDVSTNFVAFFVSMHFYRFEKASFGT